MKFIKQSSALVLAWCLPLTTVPTCFAGQTSQPAPQAPVQAAHQTPQQLGQLVAPIALYPDSLVAQILAASTYPDQIVEADRWIQAHPNLKGQQLGQEVDKQSWDPSVKALTEFPSVLANMDKNLSWTSSLGDAYVNQSQDVMDAVQTMRKRAKDAGNLKTTPQQQVSQQGQSIVIQPANPQVVYLPQYDPWLVYGGPVVAWPGWYGYPGLYLGGPGFGFGVGFGIGLFAGFGWGWGHWGWNWHDHAMLFDHRGWVSRSRVFANRGFNRGGFHGNGFHGGDPHGADAHGADPHGADPHSADAHGADPHSADTHGFGTSQSRTSSHSGAFGGFDHGGVTSGFSARGQSSFGGGSHGGGGFHGGGGHGGGGHR